jgi:hypothetical protein
VKAFKVELWLDIFVGRGFWSKVGRSTYRLGDITNPFQIGGPALARTSLLV